VAELGPRIVVIGASGSGKTTFARALAARTGLPHVELDALHWEPGWVEAPREVFRARVEAAAAAPRWVIDGNYGRVRDCTWNRATGLVWLDYPFALVFGRALRRTLRRAFTREELWNGNRESLRQALFSRDSILAWVWNSYPRLKREYSELLASPVYDHIKVARLASPREARAFLASAGKGADLARE
jgi:adenylate kinase family enzyme